MWGSIVFIFFKDLITGEVYRLWQQHKAKVKAQSIANAPATKDELVETLHEGKL